MAKPENSKSGCFSGFLRVLLCAGSETSPPVYPSEHADEPEVEHQTKDRKPVHAATTPGVVARLMGLDSLPSTKWVVKGATPDLVPRSRSVNFVDYLLEFDPNHLNNHRRVKTSSSFREVPALVQRQQKCDIFVLESDYNASKVQEERYNQVESREETGELKQRRKQGKKQGSKQGSKSKIKETAVRERVSVKKERNNQGKSKKISKLKNEPRRVPSSKQSSKVRNHNEARDFSHVSSSSKSCSCRFNGDCSSSGSTSSSLLLKRNNKGYVEPKIRNNMRNQQSPKKVEAEHSSENLSPVSVLDINDYPFLYGAEFLDGTSTIASSKPKWKSSLLLPLFLEDGVEERKNNDKCLAYTDSNSEAEYFSELMMKVCTLVEKDIRESDCTLKTENFEAICLEFEHKIFDHLLYEVVNEIVELSC
ncbi:uncharacterized protein LOC130749841 [Lotus japonicus]|uniref:uncharacterized protein LOC130749841 n=1 Tax=Lotus japonicus TaxID=34305 RepID=UPI00258612D9|nr:uncharacterized protein LOC130749841 [Lotus japonicus]